jgi:hypothetical protein
MSKCISVGNVSVRMSLTRSFERRTTSVPDDEELKITKYSANM